MVFAHVCEVLVLSRKDRDKCTKRLGKEAGQVPCVFQTGDAMCDDHGRVPHCRQHLTRLTLVVLTYHYRGCHTRHVARKQDTDPVNGCFVPSHLCFLASLTSQLAISNASPCLPCCLIKLRMMISSRRCLKERACHKQATW